MSNHLYLNHLRHIVATLEKLNDAEAAVPSNAPDAVYMEGPIELLIDGEKFGCRFSNEIGDEWCLEVD